MLFAPPFTHEELDYLRIDPEQVDFQFPRVFLNVARIGTLVQVRTGARTLTGTLRTDGLRRGLYRTAILAAVSGQDLARLHPAAAATGQTRRHNDAARTLLGASARLGGTAEQLERALQAADPALQTPTLSAVVRETRGLGVLTLGLGLMTDFAEAEARVEFLAEAAADAELLAALGTLRAVISANRFHDPMMLAGIDDAIEDLRLLGESRLRRIRAAGASALRDNSYKIGAMVVASYFGPMGALTVRELAEAQEILDGFTDKALIVAAMHNLAVQSQNGLHQLASEGSAPGGLEAEEVPLIGLAWLHTRLRAEATAATHAMLWIEPRENPFSAFAIGSALALSGRQAISGRRDLREVYERELARRAEDHRLTHTLALPEDAYVASEAEAAAPDMAEPQALSFGGFEFSLPDSFIAIDQGRSLLVYAPHDPESGDFHINHPDNPPVTVFVGWLGSGSAVLHNTRDDLRGAGYELTEVALAAPGAAERVDVFELVLPEGLDPAADGRPGFARLLSAYHRGDGRQPEVAFMLLGYYLDSAQRAEYDAARAMLLRSLQPEGGDAAEAETTTPAAPEAPPRPTRVEPCGEETDRPGFTIPWTTLCVTQNTYAVYPQGRQIRNLDFFADLAAEGINLNTFALRQPDSLEDIRGIVGSGLQRFRLENIPVDPELLAPLRRASLREVYLGLLPETEGGTITLRELNGIFTSWHVQIGLTEGTRLDMAAYNPGGTPEFSVTGPPGARVDFENIRTGGSGFETVRISGVQSDLSGLNRISRLEKLRLDNVQGADYRRLAGLLALRNLAIDGLHGDNPATLNTLFQLQRLDLRLGDEGDRTAAVAFEPGCLSHWHSLERLRLQLPGIEVDLTGRDEVRDWLASLGPSPDAEACRSGALGEVDASQLADIPRSYPIPERGRSYLATDTAPEAGLVLLRGQPHSDREHLAVYDYRRARFIARDIPAGTLRSALAFRGEDLPRILQNAGERYAARISPDGRWLVSFFPHSRRPFLRLFDLKAEGREVAQVFVAEERADYLDFITSGPDSLDVLLIGGSGFTEVALRREDGAQGRWTSDVNATREGFITGLTFWSAASLIAPEPRKWGLTAVMSQPSTMDPRSLVSVATLRRPGEGFLEELPVRLDEPLRGLVWLPGIEALAVHTDRRFGLLLPPYHPARERGLNSALAEQRFDIPDLHYLPGRDLLLLTEPHRITAFPAEALLEWLSGTGDPLHRIGRVITDDVPDLPSLDGMHTIIGPVGQEVLVVLPGPRSSRSAPHVGVSEIPLAPLLAVMAGQDSSASEPQDGAPSPARVGTATAESASGPSTTSPPAPDAAPVEGAASAADERPEDPAPTTSDTPDTPSPATATEEAGTSSRDEPAQPAEGRTTGAPSEPVIPGPGLTAVAGPAAPTTPAEARTQAPASTPASSADQLSEAEALPSGAAESAHEAQPPSVPATPVQLAEATPPPDTAAGDKAPAAGADARVARLEREVERALDMAVEADLARRRAETALDRVMAELDAMTAGRDTLRAALAEAEAQATDQADSGAEALRALTEGLAETEAEARAELDAISAERDSLRAALAAAEAKVETKADNLRDLAELLSDTEAVALSEQEAARNLRMRLAESEDAAADLRDRLSDATARLEQAEGTQADPLSNRERALLLQDLEAARIEVLRLRQRIDASEEENRSVLEALGSDLNRALAELAASRQARIDLERVEAQWSDQQAELLTRKAALHARNTALERQVAALERASADHARAEEEAQERIRELQIRVALLEARNDGLERELAKNAGAPAESAPGDVAATAGAAPDHGARLSGAPITMPADLEGMAHSVFGEDYRLASWEEISARYASEGGAFLRAAGLVPTGESGTHSAAVSFEGAHQRGGRNLFHYLQWGRLPQGAEVLGIALHPDGVAHPDGVLHLTASAGPQHFLAVPAEAWGPGVEEGVEDRFRFVTAEQLNVRSGPGTTFEAVDRLLLGSEVELGASQDGWALIGPDRWVAKSFLVPVSDAAPVIGAATVATRDGPIGLQTRMLVEGGEIARAVMVLLRPDGTADVLSLRDIVQRGAAEVVLRTGAANGIEIFLRGPCLSLIAEPGEGEARNCGMEGELRSRGNRFALRPQ